MARVKLVELEETTGAERERYEELAGRNAVTNMKRGLLMKQSSWWRFRYSVDAGLSFCM